jgi:hypothetical protein
MKELVSMSEPCDSEKLCGAMLEGMIQMSGVKVEQSQFDQIVKSLFQYQETLLELEPDERAVKKKYLYRGMLIDFEKVIGVRHTLLIFGDSSESVYSKMT